MFSLPNRRPTLVFRGVAAVAIITLVTWPCLPRLVPDERVRLLLFDPLFPVVDLLAVLALFYAARKSAVYCHRSRKAWILLGAGQVSWFLGDVIWTFKEMTSLQNPFPSIANIFFLFAYPFFILGVLHFPARPHIHGGRLKAILDMGILMIGTVLMIWNLIIGPLAKAYAPISLAKQLMSLTYILCALSMLWALLLLFGRVEVWSKKPTLFLAASMAVLVVAEILFSNQALRGVPGWNLADMGYLASTFLVALAGLYHAALIEQAPQPTPIHINSRRGPTLFGSFLSYLCILLMSALILWNYRHGFPMRFSTLALGVGAIISLASSRQFITLIENRRLNGELYIELAERRGAEHALQQLNAGLEQKVQERTHSLQEMNEQLRCEIAERRQAEDALRESEERYALAARGANGVLWDWNLKTDRIYLSSRWQAITGYQEEGLENTPDAWLDRVHPQDIERVRLELEAHLQGSTGHFLSEHRLLHRDGSYRWVLSRGAAVRDAHGVAYRLAGSLTDVTDRKNIEQQLLHNAFYDSLTGLPNRALLINRLNQAMEREEKEQDGTFAVLFLDFDRFKVVNDSLGHSAGDQLLIEGARRLQAGVRTIDTVVRLGGDEFVVLLEKIRGLDDAIRAAERIQEALRLPFTLEGREVFVSASIGIVLGETNCEMVCSKAEDVLRNADIALYRAKILGRARYVVFDPSMHLQATARLEIEADMRRALEHDEFRVHYQPIMTLSTGEITGFEALVRWEHPRLGFLMPADFLPVAEETGLIIAIDRWVLRRACQQMAIWQRGRSPDRLLTININLSGKEFSQPDLVAQIQHILQGTGLEARNLGLEITEGALVGDPVSTANLLRLQELGAHVRIDDFGTGYSSLSYLHKVPSSTIKIDRSFIARMGTDDSSSGVVKTIVRLAHDLGMDATAEGVETAAQLAQLRQLACEYGQGFFISQPLDAQAATALLARQSPASPAKQEPYLITAWAESLAERGG